MSQSTTLPVLFVHVKRPEWGLGILSEERGDSRSFLFQDGVLRTFRDGFYHLLQPADRPLDVLLRIARNLSDRLGMRAGGQGVLKQAEKRDVVRLETQIAVFRMLYPEGFDDPGYIDAFRGTGAKKRLKRHLDAASAHAIEALAKDELQRLLDEGSFSEIHRKACAVVDGTDLCAPAARKIVTELPEERHGDFAKALFDILHSDEAFFDRFTRMLDVLQPADGGNVKWTIATLLPALVHPDKHVAVKARPFALAARWAAPQLQVVTEPNAVVYDRLREMAKSLIEQLKAEGLAPRDLLDIRTFIDQSFRPKNLEMLRNATAAAKAAADDAE